MADIEFSSTIDVQLIDVMGDDLTVARAAWVSTKGARAADEADSDKVEGLINFLMKGRHGTPFEHATMTFLVSAPIFVFREWHRHRIASYNEESGRYSVLAPRFYVPDNSRALNQVGRPGHYTFEAGTKEQHRLVASAIRMNSVETYARYERMLREDVAKEVARMVLPVNIYSSMYVTMNLRALMNFLSLRTKDDTSFFPSFPQREIEMGADAVEDLFTEKFPLVAAAFDKHGRVSP